MIYDKLPVVLLSTLASEKNDSTNHIIASYILENSVRLRDMGIKDLADACHVGTGSVSRFCREIGLRDFAELRKIIAAENDAFQVPDNGDDDLYRFWAEHVSLSIKEAAMSLDRQKIQALCKDILDYDKVLAYGMLKAESAAVSLQVDLQMMNKKIGTSVSFAEQTDQIIHAGKDTLIIIFSYTGSYFDAVDFRAAEKHLLLPKIWMIAGREKEYPWFIDETILFSSKQDQLSHPYQLIAAAGLIAQEYALHYGV